MEFTSITTTDSVCLYIGDNDEAKEKANEDRSREEQRLYYVALTRAKARLYLPLVPGKLGGKRWDGGYRRLNERLSAVASNLEESRTSRIYFGLSTFHDRPLEAGAQRSGAERRRSWRRGRPKRELLKNSRRNSDAFSQLRQQPRRLHRLILFADEAGVRAESLIRCERDEFRREPGQKTLATVLGDDELPGGTATGTMLHEVLEKIPFDSLRAAPSLEQWVRLKTVDEGL